MCGSVTQRKTLIISVQNDWLEKYQIMKGTQLNGVKIQQMSFSIICSYSSVSMLYPLYHFLIKAPLSSRHLMRKCVAVERAWTDDGLPAFSYLNLGPNISPTPTSCLQSFLTFPSPETQLTISMTPNLSLTVTTDYDDT